eukprot:351882-Chlamydomonas_euryale.AAC.5
MKLYHGNLAMAKETKGEGEQFGNERTRHRTCLAPGLKPSSSKLTDSEFARQARAGRALRYTCTCD